MSRRHGQSNRLPRNVSMLSPGAICWRSPLEHVDQEPSGFGLSPKLDVQRCPYFSVIFTQTVPAACRAAAWRDDCVDAGATAERGPVDVGAAPLRTMAGLPSAFLLGFHSCPVLVEALVAEDFLCHSCSHWPWDWNFSGVDQ